MQVFEGSDIGQAEIDKSGDVYRARFGDVAQGATSDVVVVAGVGQRANPDTVQHDPDYPLD
jgi:hypothetical protein